MLKYSLLGVFFIRVSIGIDQTNFHQNTRWSVQFPGNKTEKRT